MARTTRKKFVEEPRVGAGGKDEVLDLAAEMTRQAFDEGWVRLRGRDWIGRSVITDAIECASS